MKKILALLLATVMLFGMLSACSKPTAEPPTTSEPPAESNASTTVDSDSEEREVIEVNVWAHDMDFPKDDRLVAYLEDKFDLKFNFTSYANGIYQENLRNVILSGDLPDMFPTWGPGDTNTMFDQLVTEALLLDCADLLPNYPNLWASVNYDPDTLKFLYNGDSVYGVPRKWNKDTTDRTLFIRVDWLNELGLDMPDTWEDIYEVLKDFKEAKPDGVEQVGLSMNDPFWIKMIAAGFTGVNTWYQDETGRYKMDIFHPNMKSAYEYLHKLYAEGLLDPECYVSEANRPMEYFTSGRSGIIYNASQYASCYPYFAETKKNFPDAEVAIINPIPASPEGIRSHMGIDSGYYGMYCFNKDFEGVERVLEMMDWLASEEGTKFVRYGIEGIHYTMDGDQIIVNTEECEKDEFNSNGVTSHYISYFTSIDFTFNQDMSLPYAEDIFTPSNEIGAKYSARNPVQGFVYDDVTSAHYASINDIITTYTSQFVTGQMSLDRWDEMLAAIEAVDNGVLEQAVNDYMVQFA